MKANSVRIIIISLLLLVVQVVLLNRIHLFGCATPLLLIYIIISLPLDTPRWLSLILAFALGLVSDMFTNTPGVAATTLTFTAFVQPALLSAMLPQDAADNFTPSWHTLGASKYLAYSIILTVLYCALFFLLENFGFTRGLQLLLNIAASTALTYLFILTFETIRRG